MPINILRDVLLSEGQVERYFEGQVPIHLWRALDTRKIGMELFDLVEQDKLLSNKRIRPADIKVFFVGSIKWVSILKMPRGTSTFDRPGAPSGPSWHYYRIPAQTVLPHGLAVVRDAYNPVFKATHYTIAPVWDMPLEQFKRLLCQIATAAVRESA